MDRDKHVEDGTNLRNAMEQTQKHGTACKTCRRRGRKCDKRLPRCKACEDNENLCDGYVFRWPGMAARGKLAGTVHPLTGRKKNASGSRLDACSETVAGSVSATVTFDEMLTATR